MVRGENEMESTSSSSPATAAVVVQQQQQPIMKKIEEVVANNKENDKSDKQQTAATTSLKSSSSSNNGDSNSNNSVDLDQEHNSVGPSWDSLPSVILLEIFSYLPHESRIQASQVCRHWRYALFHPSFWKKITFTLTDNDSILWSRCLSSWFKFSVQEVTIRCGSANNFVREALFVLKKLSSNRQLRKILLEPNKCIFNYPTEKVNSMNNKKLLKQLLNIIETSNCLEALSLGCIEGFDRDLTFLLEPLKHNHANNLTHLSLASVRKRLDPYDCFRLESSLFKDFNKLSLLTIDYDHLGDDLLQALNSGTMERLVIHVHQSNRTSELELTAASNNAWIAFTHKNPRCELRLSLIDCNNAVRILDRILQSAMPLTHLKVLFCKSVNVIALHLISNWYSNTLKSLIWIDSFNLQKNLLNSVYDFDDVSNPDPLVLAAWRCKHLSEIVFIGQRYFSDNLLAIVRLRHKMLQRLEFAESDIVHEESWSEREAIIDEVKEVMGKQWKLLSDEELPEVVINPLKGDIREVIMPMVLQDQK